MARRPVAVDLDGVVVDIVPTILPKLSELAGRTVTADDIQVFDIGKALGLSDAAVGEMWEWMERERAYACAPPVEGAVTALKALGADGASLLTSRPEYLRGQTVEWLARQGLSDHPLEMGLPGVKLAEAGRFRAIVEDNPTYLAPLASRVELVMLYDQPWNRTAVVPANVVRVRGWAEIAERLNEGS